MSEQKRVEEKVMELDPEKGIATAPEDGEYQIGSGSNPSVTFIVKWIEK